MKKMFILTVFMARFILPTGVSLAEGIIQTEKQDGIITIAKPKISESKTISDYFPDPELAQKVDNTMHLEINNFEFLFSKL